MSFTFNGHNPNKTLSKPFHFGVVGIVAILGVTGTFSGELVDNVKSAPSEPFHEFNFKKCAQYKNGYVFPNQNFTCEPHNLPQPTGGFTCETVQPANLSLGVIGGGQPVRPAYEFIERKGFSPDGYNFKPIIKLTPVTGLFNGEFTLVQAPVDAVIDHELTVSGSLTCSFQQQVFGSFNQLLPPPIGTLNAENVPEGNFFAPAGTLISDFKVAVGLDASFTQNISVQGGFTGTIVPTAGFNSILSLLGGFTGIISTNEATFTHTIPTPIGSLKARHFLWSQLALVISDVCGKQTAASQINHVRCATNEKGSPLVKIVESDQQSATSTYNNLCSFAELGEPLFKWVNFTVNIADILQNTKCLTQDNAKALHATRCYTVDPAIPLTVDSCHVSQNGDVLYKDVCFDVEDAGVKIHTLYGLRYNFDNQGYIPLSDVNFLFPKTSSVDFNFQGFVTDYVTIKHTRKGHLVSDNCVNQNNAPNVSHVRCSAVENAINPPQGFTPLDEYVPIPPTIHIDSSRETFTIPNKEDYIVDTTITAFIRGTSTKIPLDNLELIYSPSSFSWQMSASMQGGDIVNQLKPDDTTGEPVELDINVNGEHWYMFVEEINRSRQHTNKSVGLVCAGLTTKLGDSYQVLESFTVDTTQTTQQIVLDILDPLWTLDWQMDAWVVPANTFNIANVSPIQAIGKIVQECGGVIVPHRTSKTITVAPAYSVLPWNMPNTSPDFEFSEDIIVSAVEVSETNSPIDAVFVHGAEPAGVIGKVLKNGTAGATLAPTIHNRFAVDALSVRRIGEQFMAKHIDRPKLKQFKIPLDSAQFPLIETGKFVKITISPSDTDIPDGTHTTFSTVYGCANSVSISTNGDEVFQTISLGDHDMSLLSTFKSLIPKNPVTIGTVTSTVGGLSKVSLIGGGVVTVKGTAPVTTLVYIKDSRIEGQLPSMTVLPDTTIGL